MAMRYLFKNLADPAARDLRDLRVLTAHAFILFAAFITFAGHTNHIKF